MVLDLAGKILAIEVGDQICYTYYVPVEEKRLKVFLLRKICNGGRMKCHVVPGLNVALHYVIAVRNGIIPEKRL